MNECIKYLDSINNQTKQDKEELTKLKKTDMQEYHINERVLRKKR